MLRHEEAQELHRIIGSPIAAGMGGPVILTAEQAERALELAALVVADTEPHPADNVSYDPCITGTITANGESSEFMIPLDNDSVKYSQWGAFNPVLGDRVDLLDGMADVAREWYVHNEEETDEGGIPDE
jgi:hypothetical protein